MTAKITKIVAGACAFALAGTLLGACEAQPGVAAAGKDWTITEQELGQVSAELAQGFSVPRSYVLQLMMALHEGGREALRGCPQWEDIPLKDFQLPTDMETSETTQEVLSMALCGTNADPAYAENAGMPVTSLETIAQLEAAFQAATVNPQLVSSLRTQIGQNLLQQQMSGM